MMKHHHRCLSVVLFALALSAAHAAATLQTFDDQAAFLAATQATSATGPLPDIGLIPDAGASVDSVTFVPLPGAQGMFIGASGSGIGPFWYPPVPANFLALALEQFEVWTAAPVYALGFQIVEPDVTLPEWGGTAANSPYQVTLFSGAVEVGQFGFDVPDDRVAFVGVWSDTPFDRVQIIDTTGNNDDEYFGEFYTGTSPNPAPPLPDTDGDGIPDEWESLGLDVNSDGNIDLDLPALGANPLRKDIFLEIDYMDCAPSVEPEEGCPLPGPFGTGPFHTHRPKPAAIDLVVQAFADAPVTNPDGSTGISLHVDVSNRIPHQDFFGIPGECGVPLSPGGASLDSVKADLANFGTTNPRRFVYHYAVFAHRQPHAFGRSSGCAELPGNDFVVTLGDWNTLCLEPGTDKVLNTPPRVDDIKIDYPKFYSIVYPSGYSAIYTGPNLVCDSPRHGDDKQVVLLGQSPTDDLDGDGLDDRTVGTVLEQAGTLMHELGHNLNLHHGGGDGVNAKPNYLSVMNYHFQVNGIQSALTFQARLDYSRAALPTLRETTSIAALSLFETRGIGDGLNLTKYFCPNRSERAARGNRPIDWNCDGDVADALFTTNITGDVDSTGNPILSTLEGYDDWNNLKYDFQNSASYADGVHVVPPDLEELDEATSRRIPAVVMVDIMPRDAQNSINPRGQGLIPVAINTIPGFDATRVDPLSVQFGPSNAPEAHGRGHLEDADGDGDLDLVLHFATQATGIVCGNTEAHLSGETDSGQAITGFDAITTVGC